MLMHIVVYNWLHMLYLRNVLLFSMSADTDVHYRRCSTCGVKERKPQMCLWQSASIVPCTSFDVYHAFVSINTLPAIHHPVHCKLFFAINLRCTNGSWSCDYNLSNEGADCKTRGQAQSVTGSMNQSTNQVINYNSIHSVNQSINQENKPNISLPVHHELCRQVDEHTDQNNCRAESINFFISLSLSLLSLSLSLPVSLSDTHSLPRSFNHSFTRFFILCLKFVKNKKKRSMASKST